MSTTIASQCLSSAQLQALADLAGADDTLVDITCIEITDDGVLIVRPRDWQADDGNAEITIEDCDSAEDAAERYVEGGDWGMDEPGAKTITVSVRCWREGIDRDGDDIDVDESDESVDIEPAEPACISGESHDWVQPQSIVGGLDDNPGVFGSGGSVVIYSACRHCGCGCKVNHGAGHDQVSTETSYQPGKYDPETVQAAMEDE